MYYLSSSAYPKAITFCYLPGRLKTKKKVHVQDVCSLSKAWLLLKKGRYTY